MILRVALTAFLASAALPAFAQTDPATQPPAAGEAPKPYVPPAASDEAPPEAPVAPAITNVPPVDPAMQQAAEALATQVEDVQVIGPWTEGEKSGVWRTVMMQVGSPDKDTYRFFIQKLDRVGPAGTVLETTEIKEVAGVNGTVVGYRADEPEEETEGSVATSGDVTLFFDVVPPNGEVPETYELHFMKDRTYTFGPASN